ncbi:hypothetical protein MAR_004215 [Mya arenaria]|uniref:Galaxin-like repeats domain-containing protein n=1 Tax=Mya arenaria TaxID=6604 RepID=A0ABY7EXP2_MYAAR|nr:hypothetical protein MAR_004215 [Mya arenaria]
MCVPQTMLKLKPSETEEIKLTTPTAKKYHTVELVNTAIEMLRAELLILVVCVGTVNSATVCGIRQIDTNQEICCGQKPHGRFKDGHELGCLKDIVFDQTVMVACGNRLENRTIVEREFPNDFICCFGQFHAKENYDRCCHGEQERVYTHRLQACCSGVVVDRKVGTAQVCHGTTLIDRNARRPRLLQCTGQNGRKADYDPSSYVCCKQTDTPYILMAEDCCENKVIDRAEELCCRNNIVTKTHPSHYGCCKKDHGWTTYNELDPHDECLLTHLRRILHTNPTRPETRLGGNNNKAELDMYLDDS